MKITTLPIAMLLLGSVVFYACGGSDANSTEQTTTETTTTETESTASSGFTIEDVQVSSPLNADWIKEGKSIYESKCQACHKLTDEKLVGPGWKGVTKQRKPGWIIAMITHPDEMIKNDPEAKKLLEEFLTAMTNQNVTKEDARKVLEFMRSNDGEK